MMAHESKTSPVARPSLMASRPGAVVAMAAIAGILLFAAAFFWDRTPAREERRSRITEAVDVVMPEPLKEEEVRDGGESVRQDRVALEAGAWVQVADEQGRLQQRYRAQRLDPEPDHWMRMERPHAVMYPRPGRVVTMRADHGRARVPRRALQSGRFTGNVEIRMYRGPDGGAVMFQGDEPVGAPVLVIKSNEAHFDEVLGEIRCDDEVDVMTDETRRDEGGAVQRQVATFKGRGLLIAIDPTERTIERLVVERAVGPITITRSTVEPGEGSAPAAGAPAPTPPASSAVAAVPGHAAAPGTSVAAATPPIPTTAAATTVQPGTTVSSTSDAVAPTQAGAVASQQAPADSTSAREMRPYRLTLYDNVVIRRVSANQESIIRGDRLTALFTLQGSGLRDAFAAVFPPLPDARGIAPSLWTEVLDEALARTNVEREWPTAPTPWDSQVQWKSPTWISVPWPERLAFLAIAAQSPSVSGAPPRAGTSNAIGVDDDGTLTISYDGRLIMLPADEDPEKLEGPEDVRLTILSNERGQGGRGYVEVEDVRTLVRAKCDRLVYHGADDSVELEGSVRQPLEVESPRLALTGGRFRFERPTGHGEIPGAGRMELRDDDRPAPAAGARADAPAPPELAARDVEITWKERLDIELVEEDNKSRIKGAHFKGDVKVDHVDFALRSNGMDVLFDAAGDGEGDVVVKSIQATGGARADRLADAGSLVARTLVLKLEQNKEGKPVPTEMTARGEVVAMDKSQTLWSDDLRIVFEPRAKDAAGAPAAPESSPDRLDFGGEMGEVDVTVVQAGTLTELDAGATGAGADAAGLTTAARDAAAADRPDAGVQILLRDGARVFARRLDGNALERRVKLAGPDVMIVQKNVVADQLQQLDIDEKAGTVTATGPGRFRHFRQPLVDGAHAPRIRPDPKGAVALEATWSDSMKFDDRANGGGGSLDLAGGVRVRASRTDREYSALDAQKLQIDMRNDPNAKSTPGDASSGAEETATGGASSNSGGELFASGTRSIQRLIAKDGARLENQTWSDDRRIGEPRLFKVTGDHVEYDTITGEAKVVGNGTLLVHDTSEGRAGAAGGPDPRGSSRFKWGSTMDMVRLGPTSQQYLITMNDGVEVMHKGLRAEDTFTLTCRTLETTVLRPGVGAAAGAGAGAGVGAGAGRAGDAAGAAGASGEATAADPARGQLATSSEIDLGGPAELLRVRGLGQVRVFTPDADIECEEFDYDVRSQMAQMKARDGRLVTVLRRDNPTPIRAASVIWDRSTGRMTIQSGGGAIGR